MRHCVTAFTCFKIRKVSSPLSPCIELLEQNLTGLYASQTTVRAVSRATGFPLKFSVSSSTKSLSASILITKAEPISSGSRAPLDTLMAYILIMLTLPRLPLGNFHLLLLLLLRLFKRIFISLSPFFRVVKVIVPLPPSFRSFFYLLLLLLVALANDSTGLYNSVKSKRSGGNRSLIWSMPSR